MNKAQAESLRIITKPFAGKQFAMYLISSSKLVAKMWTKAGRWKDPDNFFLGWENTVSSDQIEVIDILIEEKWA